VGLFFELRETAEDLTSKLGLMKHRQAVDDVKIEVEIAYFSLYYSV